MNAKTEAIDTLFILVIVSIMACAMVIPFVLVFGHKVDNTPVVVCIDGYKFTDGKKHRKVQMVDEDGHGIPCTLIPSTMGVR